LFDWHQRRNNDTLIGCIFLLHGPPGVGKTLTAEAIAEMLHKPLYSVTVGELGTQTGHLEQNLRDILEVASAWDAVILIDEVSKNSNVKKAYFILKN
jgi:SpoVK/Ycf46/Vps4 family AAA+-type ATPase